MGATLTNDSRGKGFPVPAVFPSCPCTLCTGLPFSSTAQAVSEAQDKREAQTFVLLCSAMCMNMRACRDRKSSQAAALRELAEAKELIKELMKATRVRVKSGKVLMSRPA